MACKMYQPILNGKPYGSPVAGFRAALARRTIIVRAQCRRSPRPATYNIVDTPGVSQCCTCSEYCSCRIREVRHA